ncbi:MAG: amidohydrolase, partial [Candidatus Acidiferrum sp.]
MSAISLAAEKQQTADVIYVNGRIYEGAVSTLTKTGAPASWVAGALPVGRAQALAVKDGRIIAIGSDIEVKHFAGKNTQMIDLHGQFAMPGFNDAHAHLWSGGLEQLHINLLGTRSLDEMQQRIAERAHTAEPGEWLTGSGWDHTFWPGQKLPTRQDLDAVAGEHPAIFVRVDGHICVVNSAGLKFAGITRATPDPPGGKIDRDVSGEPTGILRERAREDLESKLPPPTTAQRRRAVLLGLADAARWGVTSVQESIVNPQD